MMIRGKERNKSGLYEERKRFVSDGNRMISEISHKIYYEGDSLKKAAGIMILSILFLASAANASVFYKYDIIGKTGQAGITDIVGDNPSINDNGMVAFNGQVPAGEAIFVGDGSADPVNINPGGMQTSRHFGRAVQINNANKVVAQYWVSGNPFLTRVGIWDANNLNQNNKCDSNNPCIAMGGGPGDYFATVTTHPSINNQGQVVFSAQDLTTRIALLATPIDSSGSAFNKLYMNAQNVLLRPMIADNGYIVSRLGGLSSDPIALLDYNLPAIVSPIANAAKGFTTLGRSSGISDEGDIVTFYGDLSPAGAAAFNTTPGPGIFASIDDGSGSRKILRITGRAGENMSAPDGNHDGLCDPGEDCSAAPVDLGLDTLGNPLVFSSFDIDSRVAVARQQLGAPGIEEDSFVISFIATPNAGSSGYFTNQKGIWTVRVDVETWSGVGLVYHIKAPMVVAQVGDTFGGRWITDLRVYDQIANAATNNMGESRTQNLGEHRIALWASTDQGDMVVRATRMGDIEINEIKSDKFVEPSSEDPEEREVTIVYEINPPDSSGDLEMKIFDDDSIEVYSRRLGYVRGGEGEVKWDGKKANGEIVNRSKGPYSILLVLTKDGKNLESNKHKVWIGRPVILLHGIFSNPVIWDNPSEGATMEATLENDGFWVYKSDYAQPYSDFFGLSPSTNGDIRAYGGNLNDEIIRIKKETGSKKVDIVAHSMGGLVTRIFMEGGGGRNVNKLIMLGTPNRGCELLSTRYAVYFIAAYFAFAKVDPNILIDTVQTVEELIGDAGRQMTPNSYFLESLGYSGKSNYYAIAGTNPHSWLTAGGYILKLFPQNWGYPSDGVVSLRSVWLEGSKNYAYPVNHLEYYQNNNYPDIYKMIKTFLSSDSTGTSYISLSEESSLSTGSENNSFSESGIIEEKIYPNEKKSYDVVVSFAKEAHISSAWLGGDLTLTLTSPSGVQIYPSDVAITYYDSNFNEGYIIQNPEPGIWTVNITAVNVSSKGVDYTILTILETNLTFSIGLSKYQYIPKELINVTANLTNNGGAILGASVTAKIYNPDNLTQNVTLYDDGLHNDNLSNDGVYGNTYTNTTLSGIYDITVSANGTINGEEFEREAFTTVWVEQYPDLTLLPSDISFSNNAPSAGDNVTINATIYNIGDVNASNVSIFFYDGDPSTGRSIGEVIIPNMTVGSTGNVSASWTARYGTHDIYVGISPFNSFPDKNYTNNIAYKTINVTGIPPSSFNDVYSDYGVDTNGDGLYDHLTTEIGINATTEGYYSVTGWLYDNKGNYTAFTSNYTYLDVGERKINLTFDGVVIYKHGISGQFNLSSLMLQYEHELIDYREHAYDTSSYNYTDFQKGEPETPLLITITSPANNSVNDTGYLNVTAILDRTGTAILNWNGANESMDGGGTNFYKNKTGLLSGIYVFKVYANDTAGTTNVTETRIVKVDVSITTDVTGNVNATGYVNATLNIPTPDEDITVTIPDGTVAKQSDGTPISNITADSLESLNSTLEAAASNSSLSFIGKNLTLLPEGAQFDPYILVRFNYSDADIPAYINESDLKVYWYNHTTGSWETLVTHFHDTILNYLIARVPHASMFALLGLDTPPASITALSSINGTTWLNWTWTNPVDADFNYTMVFLNGSWKENRSEPFYNATGFAPDTEHTIATRTVDTSDNINQTWVNHTARTAPVPFAVNINITGIPVMGINTTDILKVEYTNFTSGDPYNISITAPNATRVYCDSGNLTAGTEIIPINWTPSTTGNHTIIAWGRGMIDSTPVYIYDSAVVSPIPELSTAILTPAGLLGVLLVSRKFRKN
jgi:pimeloyl-ACP methyl ester carboxylesterase